MPTDTGVWLQEDLSGHDFSYRLAKWIGEYLPKHEPIIDIGCGQATYLRYLHDLGFSNLCGIEGTEQNFEFGNVAVADLTKPYIIPNLSSHVICLEVGEHIPKEHKIAFLQNLTNAVGKGCKLILSWAIPGQDGIGHVNCLHNIVVVDMFQNLGFKFLLDDSLNARSVIENRFSYFRNTLLIFEKI